MLEAQFSLVKSIVSESDRKVTYTNINISRQSSFL